MELAEVSKGIRSAGVSWLDQVYLSSISLLLHQEYLTSKGTSTSDDNTNYLYNIKYL